MKKEEAEALLDRGDLGPIDGYLWAIATEKKLPVYAVGMCLLRMEEAAPVLRAVLAKAANGDALTDDQAQFVFRGVYILGGARDTAACRDMLRLLRRPREELDDLLGDCVPESMARILAGVFDGDVDALFSLIMDRSVDDFSREQVFRAATFLTWNGSIGRDRMRGLLETFDREKPADDEDQTWYAWQEAIALLGLRDLAPLVHRAFEDGRIPGWMIKPHEFDEMLVDAEECPEDIARFEEAHLGYIKDAADEMVGMVHDYDDDHDDVFADDDVVSPWAPSEPVRNPFRDVGRNDPCPCGSGKKYKKCCLSNSG